MYSVIRGFTVAFATNLFFSVFSYIDTVTISRSSASVTDAQVQASHQLPVNFSQHESRFGSTAASYVIKRSKTSDAYTVWQFDINSPSLFNPVVTNPGVTFPNSLHLGAIGGYLMSYSSILPTGNISYQVLNFDPANPDPLNGEAVRQGKWDKGKFLGYDHFTWDPGNSPDILQLVPMTGYVMAYMPTSTRATYRLWNFDQEDTRDPISCSITPQGAFSLISGGSQLLPIGNYVLEWMAATSSYRVWSFDPQEMIPLQLPVISEGVWPSIDTSHELLVIGDYLLDWVPASGDYRLWLFVPQLESPLQGPIRSGTLPAGFDISSILTSIQNTVPVDAVAAETPGTMDFMRDKIEHVVVYMLESRSMDSVLGWLYTNDPPVLNYINAEPPFRGASLSYSNQANGQTYNVYQFKNGKLSEDYELNAPFIDPFHDTPDGIRQQYSDGYEGYFSGVTPDMGGYVKNNASGEVMVTFTPEQLPVLNGLASSFAVSDDWFSALPGGTDSNRAFALTGSSFNITTTYEGGPQYKYFPDQARRQSIWKVLWNNGIEDWKIYWSVKWYDYIFTYHLYLDGDIPTVDENVASGGTDYIAPIAHFFADAASGTLPRFSFLEPTWIAPTGSTSYHPGGDLVPPEKELNKIYQAITNGPGWDKTALVITFSKGGGLYDHVPPPKTIKPWPKDSNDGFKYDVLGPRVPAIVVSPWVEPNTVFRSPMEEQPLSATSLPATLLEWFGIPKARWGLGDRLQRAKTFEEVFQRQEARTDKPIFSNPYDASYPAEPEIELAAVNPGDQGAVKTSYSYTLSFAEAEALYPNAVWLPPAYAPCFTSLVDTVQAFTLGSAINSHISNPTVKVTFKPTGNLLIELESTGSTQEELATFAQRHLDFMPVAKEALNGVNYCKDTPDCWRSLDIEGNGYCQTKPYVWAMFVSWAVALDKNSSVNLMDYPPNSDMKNASSTNNITMDRWNHVLETVGVPKPDLGNYEVIVNTRPIAAPGAGLYSDLPQTVNAADVFANPAANPSRDWIGQGLGFFTNPPSNQFSNALPILVMGSPARKTWSELINQPVPVLGHGKTTSLNGKSQWWVATNHPNVTMYSCCPNDPAEECRDNANLVANDKIDLTAACMQYALGQNPDANGNVISASCNATWNSEQPAPDIAMAICIDARMSYNFNSAGQCECEAAARAFCEATVGGAGNENANACYETIPGQAQMCTQYNERFCDAC